MCLCLQACLLLSLEGVYPPAYQLALDMLKVRNHGLFENSEFLIWKKKILRHIHYYTTTFCPFTEAVDGERRNNWSSFVKAATFTSTQVKETAISLFWLCTTWLSCRITISFRIINFFSKRSSILLKFYFRCGKFSKFLNCLLQVYQERWCYWLYIGQKIPWCSQEQWRQNALLHSLQIFWTKKS